MDEESAKTATPSSSIAAAVSCQQTGQSSTSTTGGVVAAENPAEQKQRRCERNRVDTEKKKALHVSTAPGPGEGPKVAYKAVDNTLPVHTALLLQGEGKRPDYVIYRMIEGEQVAVAIFERKLLWRLGLVQKPETTSCSSRKEQVEAALAAYSQFPCKHDPEQDAIFAALDQELAYMRV